MKQKSHRPSNLLILDIMNCPFLSRVEQKHPIASEFSRRCNMSHNVVMERINKLVSIGMMEKKEIKAGDLDRTAGGRLPHFAFYLTKKGIEYLTKREELRKSYPEMDVFEEMK